MATPSIKDIQNQILAAKDKQESLAGLTSTSKVAVYRLWAFIVASIAWVQYQFFEKFQEEIDNQIANQKLFTLLWFRNAALAYRHGFNLDENTASYDLAGYTDEQIETATVVDRSAVVELELNNRKQLFIKVAKEAGEDLAPLSGNELEGLRQYFARIKPAGTKIVIFSDNADDLSLIIDFYYNPLILDENGVRIDASANTPVQDTIRDYLKNLKFNGEFTVAELENRLQNVEGCADQEVYIRNAEANYQNPPSYVPITSSYIANSGYMQIIDANLTINFIAKTVAL
ncbi:MAG: hypothetical protein V7767_00700 [Leeuwenhoekiella sp.]